MCIFEKKHAKKEQQIDFLVRHIVCAYACMLVFLFLVNWIQQQLDIALYLKYHLTVISFHGSTLSLLKQYRCDK